jgi:Flp pilus assembly protein TadG
MLLQSSKPRSRRSTVYRESDSRQDRKPRRRGAAVVELALTLAILFGVCYGTIEFGYYFFVKNTLEGAAREGCRAGIVGGATNSNVASAALTQLVAAGLVPSATSASGSGPYTIGNYTLDINDTTSGTNNVNVANMTPGDTLEVEMTASWGTVGAAFSPEHLIGSSKSVTVYSCMRKEAD